MGTFGILGSLSSQLLDGPKGRAEENFPAGKVNRHSAMTTIRYHNILKILHKFQFIP
jgi:hypothetical protein